MELKVNTQNERLNVKKTLDQSRQRVDEGLKQLPSSLQLLSVKDNVPETAISNAFKDKMSELRGKIQTQQEEISNLQVSDNTLSKIQVGLVRMKDLATQATSGKNDANQMRKLNKAFDKLKSEIGGELEINHDENTKTTSAAGKEGLEIKGLSFDKLGINELTLDATKNAQEAMKGIDKALSATNDAMKRVGAKQNKQQYDYDNTIESLGNLSTSESTNWDTNQAYDMMQSTSAMILQHPGTAMLSQANQAPQQLLQLLGR